MKANIAFSNSTSQDASSRSENVEKNDTSGIHDVDDVVSMVMICGDDDHHQNY